ncbi:MAG TPA: YihY family inner membrane protein [Casimicrobiaceae bacterium]|nr:YihY family inner membrane protein [Casimicrobiaceae bacterium]
MSGVFLRLSGVGLARTAAALSFTTVLGLVPVFTVAFVYVARYPLFERFLSALERFLVRHLLPGSGPAVRPYLDEFTARAANLQGVGIAIVVVTAVMLIAMVESEINAIWGARERRSVFRRLAIYAVGCTLGPITIGAAVYSTNWLLEATLAAEYVTKPEASELRSWLAIGLATLVFTLLYALLPARRVPLRAAIAGGLVAALAFEGAKRGFVLYVTHVPTYQRVYGAVAVLPLFLVWIFVSWVVVLFGAAVTATLTEGPPRGRGRIRR